MFDAILCQTDVQPIEMLGANFGQFEMTDRRIDPLAQMLVQLDGAVLCTGMFFELDDIVGIFRKGFAVIQPKTLSYAVLKLDGYALCLPLGILF